MATTRFVTRSLLTTTKQSLTSAFSRSYTSLSLSTPPPPHFSLLRLRPLAAAHFRRLTPATAISTTTRSFATRQTSSSLSDPNPNWSNRPPKETILLDGCDFEHWLVVMEKPEGDPTRDDIIDSYIKTLATIVGSEEEARMKIYSVSTRHYYAFGALVSEELSYKLKELPKVRWVLPDSYLDVKNKDYGGEPFINGQAVPYDPKYHEEWVRNSARANERNRRNDRPRNFDRSRNFERRGPSGNMGPPNPGQNMAGGPPPNMAGGPPPNMGGMPPTNMGGRQPSNMGAPPNYSGGAPPNNMGGVQPNNQPNFQYGNGPSSPNTPYQSVPGPHQTGFAPNAPTGNPYQNQNMPYQSGPGPNQTGFAPNTAGGNPYQNQNTPYQSGPGPNQGGYPPNTGGANPYQNQNQNQNFPGRDMPPPRNYQ